MVYQLSYLSLLIHVGHCLHKAHLYVLKSFLGQNNPLRVEKIILTLVMGK